MGCFHYVTYRIFALWFNLNEIFVIKFTVSFTTVVERTRPSHVFIEVFARQKNLKRATGHLFLQRTTQAAWNPCCDDGKLVSLFIQCLTSVAVMICMWLFFFFFPRSLFWVASLVPLAHFPRFCWHYFSLSTKFLIHSAKKTYFLLCSGFWNTF